MNLEQPAARAGDALLHVHVRRTLREFTLDVNFHTAEGIVALVGPSGAGKTLTLDAIAGLLHPDSGRIIASERVLFDSEARIYVKSRDRNIGYVFQHYALFPHMTVAQNIAFGLHRMPRTKRESRVKEMLDVVDLSPFGNRHPDTLSGGQRQRVALARALAPSPSVLLLDEPLAALDAPLRLRLGAELRRLHELFHIPMVLVTHDPAEAERIADSIVSIDGGRVVSNPVY